MTRQRKTLLNATGRVPVFSEFPPIMEIITGECWRSRAAGNLSKPITCDNPLVKKFEKNSQYSACLTIILDVWKKSPKPQLLRKTVTASFDQARLKITECTTRSELLSSEHLNEHSVNHLFFSGAAFWLGVFSSRQVTLVIFEFQLG